MKFNCIVLATVVSFTVASLSAETIKSSAPKVSQTALTKSQSEEKKLKIIPSFPAAVAAIKNRVSTSSAGPLTLTDGNANGSPVNHLKIGAYPHETKYLYTVGIFNSGDAPVEIESIGLPDNYFKASWPSSNTIKPNQMKFLRLICDKPLDKKAYPIIVNYRDKKYPPQTLSMTLYPSGAQLYNEMHSN